MLCPKGRAGSTPASGTPLVRGNRVVFARLAVAAVALLSLSGCSSPDDQSQEFEGWASTLDYVASVEATSSGGDGGSLSAHLVVDGAITPDQLASLSDELLLGATDRGIREPDINLIVGNAWGFAIDAAGTNVATVNTLRSDPLLVGATVWYQPLEDDPDYPGGLRATVGSQAGLRDAPAALVAAYIDAGGAIDGAPVSATTADGAFGISGTGEAEPDAAIALWQAIAGRVLPLEAHAALADGTESLRLTVGSAEDQAAAEALAAEHPDVELTVTR